MFNDHVHKKTLGKDPENRLWQLPLCYNLLDSSGITTGIYRI